jgi:hypothetical protein
MSQDIVSTLLAASGQDSPFPATSRYYGLPIKEYTLADGRVVPYVARRFIPPPDRFALLALHTVIAGERIDTVAAQYLGDPTQYWRIADANAARQPEALTAEPGQTLRITLPDGVPAPGDGDA